MVDAGTPARYAITGDDNSARGRLTRCQAGPGRLRARWLVCDSYDATTPERGPPARRRYPGPDVTAAAVAIRRRYGACMGAAEAGATYSLSRECTPNSNVA